LNDALCVMFPFRKLSSEIKKLNKRVLSLADMADSLISENEHLKNEILILSSNLDEKEQMKQLQNKVYLLIFCINNCFLEEC